MASSASKRLFAPLAVAAAFAVSPLFPAGAAIQMPSIVSHRGESVDRPENSMAAFRLAFERGVDGVECDVYCTSDGVPVIIHDSTTGRTAGSGTNLTVTASTWDDLKDVRIGAFSPWTGTEWEGETIPKLADYLALLSMNSTTRCIIELKGNGANNLVAKVVEAVQAQPLATADRVVFIAFDFSLISAIRAALPSYEAWLLYSSGTYTGAGLVSAIQENNATGVDVHYQATFSAEDVAAVKAAGHAFAVWTCNDDAAAFALAQKGVDEITTDRGGEMKTNLAAAIDDYNSGYAEISDARFPAGATAMEPGAYAKQSDLVGHFDGIRNAGANLPHDQSTRTWKNLVAGGPDAPFTGNGGYWTVDGKGFYFNGSSVYARLASPGIDLNHETLTIQLVLDAPTSQQPLGKNYYPGLFYSSDSDDFGFFLNNSDGKNRDSTLRWKVKAYRTDNRPTIASWGGKYVTGLFTKSNQYLFEGTQLANGQSCSSRTDKGAKQWSWGGSAVETSTRYAKGTYYSVRIYNASLTEDELVWNRLVDEVRFRGVVTNGTVFVASNRAGAEGTEASGQYYVNGNHTFTAPATVTVGDRVYEPAGYKLETYDPAKKTWNLAGVFPGTSFAYTNCTVNTGARITWNWRLKDGVKKIDVDDYIQGGLVYQLDGIRNAGLAEDHAANSSSWMDLVSGTNAILDTWSTAHPERWTDKGYDFDGNCFFYSNIEVPLDHQAAIQVVADYNEGVQTKTWPHLFTRHQNSDGFNSWTYRNGSDYSNCGNRLRFGAANFNGKDAADVQPWEGRFANYLLDYDKVSVSQTETPSWVTGSSHNSIGSYKWSVGAGQTSGNWPSVAAPRGLVGVVHAFRIYDRVLTEDEIRHNMEIDHCRFFAGAGRSTGTDLVEVVSEVPAIKPADAGCWIVRGTASKTFTAEETVTVGTVTYACAGYRMETWNAAKRMWENPVVTADARSVPVSGTDGAANRRITWLWTIRSGLRTAADYTTADYVQQGLVANYDGICNIRAEGNGVTHTAQSLLWRDLSYRDVAMKSRVENLDQQRNRWAENARSFNAGDSNAMETQEEIELGNENTVQAVLTGAASGQSKDYPTFLSVGYPYSSDEGKDYGFFTRKTNGYKTLEAKFRSWVISSNPTLANWGGRYITQVMTPAAVSLFQGTAIENTFARDRNVGFPLTKVAIGGPSSKSTYTGNDISCRSLAGTYNALRLYNRALTEAELAQNRKVDEIRYRGNFADYVNVTVDVQVPFEGVIASVSPVPGDYEVDGSYAFTAGSITVEGVTFAPRCAVSVYENGEWSEPVEHVGAEYVYTAGAKTRIVWRWADVSSPITALWTGAGRAGDLSDPANWTCRNADGDVISGAVPASYTVVTVDGETAFTIPEGTETLPWKEVRFGAGAHGATQWGWTGYEWRAGMSNTDWKDRPIGEYRPMGEGGITLLEGDGTQWQKRYLHWSEVRFDGWLHVSAAQAGTWAVRQKYDDYFAIALDGEWVIANKTYTDVANATIEMAEGWHRLRIVAGDTWGSYGSRLDSNLHMLMVSINGAAEVPLTGGFTFGGDRNTLSLSADCDWRALGTVVLDNATTVDLAGHELKVSGLTANGFIGATITNSAAATAVLRIFAADGETAVNEGVTVAGNVKVVKDGPGTFAATMARQPHTGGTVVAAGTLLANVAGDRRPFGAPANIVSNGSFDEGSIAVSTSYGSYSKYTYGSGAYDGFGTDNYDIPGWSVSESGTTALAANDSADWAVGQVGTRRFGIYLNGPVTMYQTVRVPKAGTYRFSMLAAAAKKTSSGVYDADVGAFLVKDGAGEIELAAYAGADPALHRLVSTVEIPEAGDWTLELRNKDQTRAAVDDVELCPWEGDLRGGEVEIAAGAVFELNGKANYGDTYFVLDGGTIQNTAADLGAAAECISFLRLKRDSKFIAAYNAGFVGRTPNASTAPSLSAIDLSGKTLEVEVSAGKSFRLDNAVVSGGTVDMVSGGYLAAGAHGVDARNATVLLDSAIAASGTFSVSNVVVKYNGDWDQGPGALDVYGTFRPETAGGYFYGPTMQNGSTLDFSAWNADDLGWPVKSRSSKNANVSKTVKFASGAAIVKVALGGAAKTKALATSEDPYIMKWGDGAEKPSGATGFVFDDGDGSSACGYELEVDDTGLKIVPKRGFAIRIAENKDVTVPGEWVVEKMGESFGTQIVDEWLGGTGANGLPRWQSWLLGLEPADAKSVVLCRAAEAQPGDGTFAVGANIDVQAGSGADITAYLDTSSDGENWKENAASQTLTSGGTVSFNQSLASGQRGFYRIRLAVQ